MLVNVQSDSGSYLKIQLDHNAKQASINCSTVPASVQICRLKLKITNEQQQQYLTTGYQYFLGTSTSTSLKRDAFSSSRGAVFPPTSHAVSSTCAVAFPTSRESREDRQDSGRSGRTSTTAPSSDVSSGQPCEPSDGDCKHHLFLRTHAHSLGKGKKSQSSVVSHRPNPVTAQEGEDSDCPLRLVRVLCHQCALECSDLQDRPRC